MVGIPAVHSLIQQVFMEHILCARYYPYFQAGKDLRDELVQLFHFGVEETHGQRGEVTCPRPLNLQR